MRVSLAVLFLATPVLAQQHLTEDTLTTSTPGILECGFCATERFGVVFRDLAPPLRGLLPIDFPLTLDTVDVALGAALGGATCTPQQTGGSVTLSIEIYAGATVPTGSILALPDGAWPGETLLWAGDGPVTLSVADSGGNYSLEFTSLQPRDDMAMPIRADAGFGYLRVVATLPAGAATNPTCTAHTLGVPDGFPFSDGDNALSHEHSFIYAAGTGWLWNEQAGVNGDWGLRMGVFIEGSDGGTPMPDAGPRDAGTDAAMASIDAAMIDGGPRMPAGGGCGCRVPVATKTSLGWLLALIGAMRLRRRSPVSRRRS